MWTVNRTDLIRELLDDPRVAGIVTNVPARALELRRQGEPRSPSPP